MEAGLLMRNSPLSYTGNTFKKQPPGWFVDIKRKYNATRLKVKHFLCYKKETVNTHWGMVGWSIRCQRQHRAMHWKHKVEL